MGLNLKIKNCSVSSSPNYKSIKSERKLRTRRLWQSEDEKFCVSGREAEERKRGENGRRQSMHENGMRNSYQRGTDLPFWLRKIGNHLNNDEIDNGEYRRGKWDECVQ